MATVGLLSKHVRSKNAGPFWITMDIFCDSQANYETIKNSGKLCPQTISELYRVDAEMVQIFFIDSIKVVKISIPREFPEGDAYDRDMHGGQQYIELFNLEI